MAVYIYEYVLDCPQWLHSQKGIKKRPFMVYIVVKLRTPVAIVWLSELLCDVENREKPQHQESDHKGKVVLVHIDDHDSLCHSFD